MIRRFFSGKYSRLKRTAAVIAVLILVLYLALVSLITSNTFSHWVVSKAQTFVPELTISDLEGNFFSGLKLNGKYSTDDITVKINSLNTSINSRCLWKLSICIDFVKAKKITVTLVDRNKEKKYQPIQLPSISIPVSIVVKQLDVQKLIVKTLPVDKLIDKKSIADKSDLNLNDKTTLYQADNLTARASIKQSTVFIDKLSTHDNYCDWAGKARVVLNKNYPLTSTISCKNVSAFGSASATISGSVADLKAVVTSTIHVNEIVSPSELTDSPVVTTVSIQLKPLEENLPIKADLDLNEPLRILLNPHYIDLIDTTIHVDGFVMSPVLSLDANLSSDINPENSHVTASVSFKENVLSVDAFKIDLPEGEIMTKGTLSLVDSVDWLGEMSWKDVSLEQWSIIPSTEWLIGKLSGTAKTNIQYKNDILNAAIKFPNISGILNEKPLLANGGLTIKDNDLTVENFVLNYADKNKITAKGTINQNTVNLHADYALDDLSPFVESFSANASGKLAGKASVMGTLDSPDIHVDATAKNIIYNQLQISHSTAFVDWNSGLGKNNTVNVKVEGIRTGESAPSNASIVLNGTIKNHNLLVDWVETNNQKEGAQKKGAELRCSGKFPSKNSEATYERWVGVCDDLNIWSDWQGKQLRWTLTDAVEVDYSANPLELSISTFCLKNNSSKVCNEEFINYSDGDIASLSIVGEKLPVSWAKPFLPNNMIVEGDWEFVLQGNNVIVDNHLTAEIMATNAAVIFLSEDGTDLNKKGLDTKTLEEKHIQAEVDIKKLFARWHWNNIDETKSTITAGNTKKGHRITWELNTEKNGDILGHLNIVGQLLEGELIAQKIQLESLSNIVVPNPEDVVTGEVNGQLTLTGMLDRPVFNGQLALSSGYVESAMTPVPVKNITMDLDVNNNVALLNGTFDVNEGAGVVNGKIDWQVETWSGELQLIADAIAFQPEPKMSFILSPDLRLSMSPEELVLSGVVTIPKARVEVEELPEQAISESNDTVIVGEKIKAPQQQIKTSLQLVLGEDVQFKGFGLETNISGDLSIQQKNNELLKADGVLELKKGRYKAYGQNLLIQEGDLVFVGNIENPQLRVSAIRAGITDDVTVGLLATGAIMSPRISLFSQPSMPQQAQLSYLLTGNAPGVEVSTDPALAATEAALSYALASDVGLGFTKKAGEALGIEDLQLTAGSSPASSSEGGTQIGLSGYVTPKLMVRYGVGVFDAFNSLTLNYRLSKNLYLEVISGESSALDLLWSFERD
ncbi:MAG: translocation/assembly module TamB domain-containing protein [Cellvibrionaceae bacterium]